MTIQCSQSNPVELYENDFEYTDINCTSTQETTTSTPTVSVINGFSYDGILLSFFAFVFLLYLVFFTGIPKLKRNITEK
jgi:hypothetical protein